MGSKFGSAYTCSGSSIDPIARNEDIGRVEQLIAFSFAGNRFAKRIGSSHIREHL